MARIVSLSGQTYSIPERGDVGWGSLTDLLERLTNDVNSLNVSQLADPIPLRRRVKKVLTSPDTFLASDDVVLIATNSISSFNLPDTSTIQTGKVITVKDELGVSNTLNIEIVGFGSQTIDGDPSYTINENFGDQSFIKKEDGNWAKISVIPEKFEFGLLPVGSIIPLTTHLTGSITPPASGVIKEGLMLCDGSTIPSGAKLSGTLPNLTDERFLMGSTSSGTSGLATDLTHGHDFSHTHGTDSQLSTIDFSHDHSGSTDSQSVVFTTAFIPTSGGSAAFDKISLNSDQIPHSHEYGLAYHQRFAQNGQWTGDDRIFALRNYPISAWTIGGYVGGLVSKPVNTSTGSGAIFANCQYVQVFADTEQVSATWTSSIVSTSFTNPTFNPVNLNGNQTAHNHTIASSLNTEDFSHTHSTNSQSTSTTSSALSAISVRPKFFEVIYLMRVL